MRILEVVVQDPVCAAGEDEAMASYRLALGKSVRGASIPNPLDVIGDENLSSAKVASLFTRHPKPLEM